MGNSSGKEARGSAESARNRGASEVRQDTPQEWTGPPPPPPSSRPRRGSRPDLSFLGIGGTTDQDVASLEARRESKHEREVRKAEKERTARLKERERSMREEHVDGGYLVTQGVYVGAEDYNKTIVRQLMIERRLAPFWRGLNDFSESWAEHQLMAAARGMPIPPADEVPPELEYTISKKPSADNPQGRSKSSKTIGIPIGSKAQPYQAESSPNSPTGTGLSLPSPSVGTSTSPGGSGIFRTRAKTLASLSTASRTSSQTEMVPRELQLPKDPFVNGQPVEAYLYKDSSECPICFLYYPPYLNTTRCCEQAICSECFVQIKRPDPHPPEHEQPDPNAPPVSEAEREAQADGQLVSEVAACPYCKQPEFGISYTPPTFRRGLTYGTGSQPYQARSAMSSQTSLSSAGLSPGPGRRRGTSLSANSPEVITTDRIRPDWANKLATARAHAARRSAAATALHTAAYLMNGQADSVRPFGPFGRRGILRRPTLEGPPGTNAHLDALAMLAGRHAAMQQEAGGAEVRSSSNPFLAPPRGSSSRRSRMEDLEDMMMMEAIRLSLASEEERRRKEEKEAKKKEKEEAKKAKKAEKSGRKNSLFTLNSNTSTNDTSEGDVLRRERSATVDSIDEEHQASGKGKAVDREGSALATNADDLVPQDRIPIGGGSGSQPTSLLSTSQESLSGSFPPSLAAEPFRRSHLRQMSNVSSAASSFVEGGSQGQGFAGSSTPPGGGAGMDSMFNFRSLAAAMIDGDEEKGGDESSSHVENAAGSRSPARPGSFESIGEPSPVESSAEKGAPGAFDHPRHASSPEGAGSGGVVGHQVEEVVGVGVNGSAEKTKNKETVT